MKWNCEWLFANSFSSCLLLKALSKYNFMFSGVLNSLYVSVNVSTAMACNASRSFNVHCFSLIVMTRPLCHFKVSLHIIVGRGANFVNRKPFIISGFLTVRTDLSHTSIQTLYRDEGITACIAMDIVADYG